MKVFTAWFTALTMLFFLLTPVQAGWKEKLAKNQIKAIHYITTLQKGGDPDKIPRPHLRRDRRAKASAPMREMREAIAEAEKYARAGKHRLIKTPNFKHRMVTDDKYKELKQEFMTKR